MFHENQSVIRHFNEETSTALPNGSPLFYVPMGAEVGAGGLFVNMAKSRLSAAESLCNYVGNQDNETYGRHDPEKIDMRFYGSKHRHIGDKACGDNYNNCSNIFLIHNVSWRSTLAHVKGYHAQRPCRANLGFACAEKSSYDPLSNSVFFSEPLYAFGNTVTVEFYEIHLIFIIFLHYINPFFDYSI